MDTQRGEDEEYGIGVSYYDHVIQEITWTVLEKNMEALYNYCDKGIKFIRTGK